MLIFEKIKEAVEAENKSEIKIADLIERLKKQGFWLMLMVLVLPNCVPIPVPPGVSTLFSLPLFLLLGQIFLRYEYPHMPKFIGRKTVKKHMMVKVVSAVEPRLKWLDKRIKEGRYAYLLGARGDRVITFFALLFTASIAVPLPMTNFLPGIGILLMCLGRINRDGLFMLIGIGIGVYGILVTAMFLYFGQMAVAALFGA